MADSTVVHLLRHGEVHNPEGVLYGRRDGYHLSDLGRKMAQRVAETVAERDIVHLRTSPLERAQETAAPLAAARELTPVVDPRVIESGNVFEGKRFGVGDGALRKPSALGTPLEPAGSRRGASPTRRSPPGCSPPCTTRATPPVVTRP